MYEFTTRNCNHLTLAFFSYHKRHAINVAWFSRFRASHSSSSGSNIVPPSYIAVELSLFQNEVIFQRNHNSVVFLYTISTYHYRHHPHFSRRSAFERRHAHSTIAKEITEPFLSLSNCLHMCQQYSAGFNVSGVIHKLLPFFFLFSANMLLDSRCLFVLEVPSAYAGAHFLEEPDQTVRLHSFEPFRYLQTKHFWSTTFHFSFSIQRDIAIWSSMVHTWGGGQIFCFPFCKTKLLFKSI